MIWGKEERGHQQPELIGGGIGAVEDDDLDIPPLQDPGVNHQDYRVEAALGTQVWQHQDQGRPAG